MRRLARALDGLIERPRPVLAALVAAQILATLVFALSVRHNGWIWYQGGDQIWYSTTGWLFAHGQLPYALVGYGWALVLMPIMALTGPDFVGALPPTIVLDVLVLGPLATLCVYWLGARIGGRLTGLWCTAVWIALPYAAIPLFVDRYHDRYVEQFLPQALGLTEMADYPSMVALLVAAVLVLRSLDRGAYHEAVLAGLVMGFAAGMKPSNFLFLAGPGLAYLLARRWRAAAAFAAALAPTALALALWKQRGLGQIPLLSLGETRSAAGWSLPLADNWYDRWTRFDWDVFRRNMDELREFFWSARLVQWAPIAGVFAVARRSPPAAGLLAGWLATFLVVKGTAEVATIASGSFWRLMMPAFPAFVLLAASIPLLVPTLIRRLGPRVQPVEATRVGRRAVIAAAVVLAAVPIAVTGLWHQVRGPEHSVVLNGILTPVDSGSVAARTTRAGASQHLTWSDHTSGGKVFYRVFRTTGSGSDTTCEDFGVAKCTITMDVLGTTRARSFVDGSPPPGVSYRVGVAANWEDNPEGGDVIVLSPPVEAAR